MKKIYILVLLSFLNLFLFAQIQLKEARKSKKYEYFTQRQWDSLYAVEDNITLEQVEKTADQPYIHSNCLLNKIVFGWHLYTSPSSYPATYDWGLFSHFCYFAYDNVNVSTGAISTKFVDSWTSDKVIDSAKKFGLNVILAISILSSDNVKKFLNNTSAQQTLINNLVANVQLRSAQGVNIDFESPSSSQKDQFTNFLINLANAMHSAIPGSQVSFDMIPSKSASYDILSLTPYIDYFILMGYNYYYSTSTNAGPVDPLYGFTVSGSGNLANSIVQYLNLGIPNSKFVLGLPYYGRIWETSGSEIPSTNIAYVGDTIFSVIKKNSSGHFSTELFDDASFSPYYSYQYLGTWRQCFIDDGNSMGQRFDIINQFGLRGLAIFRLGFDGKYKDYWDKIKEKFSSCGSVPCSNTLYDMGGPKHNYNLSENYTYTIAPTNATNVSLTFLEFNTQANKDILSVYDGPTTASPLIKSFSGSSLPPTVISSGNSITISFISDGKTNASGFKIASDCAIGGGTPDLVVQNAQVPANITPGVLTTVSCKNKNQGTGSAGISYTAIWLSQDQTFDGAPTDINLNADLSVPNLAIDAISAKLSGQITIPYGISPGTWYIMFGADAINQVNEGVVGEKNNQVFVPITVKSPTTYTTCSANFYDDGGPSGDYPNNQNYTVTLIPSTPEGKVSVTFNSFSTQTHYLDVGAGGKYDDDILYVYNGNSTSAPQIGAMQGVGYGTVTSTAPDGSLTFKFVSHTPYNTPPSGSRAGWKATISCSSAPPTDITMIAGTAFKTCSGNFYDGGGLSGDYMNNQNNTVTLIPSTPEGKVSVTFNSFSTQTHYLDVGAGGKYDDDILYVYNGNSTSAPQIGAMQGVGYGTVTSTAPDGSLTFKFVSHTPYNTPPSGSRAGWKATISCSSAPPTDITMIAGTAFKTCSGNFYDGGGLSGDYMNNQNNTVTLIPSTPEGKVSVTFNSFSTQTHYLDVGAGGKYDDDILYVYNGNSTSAPLIGTPLSGQIAVGMKTSTAPDGSLTFKFVSHTPYNTPPSGIRAGWSATISCSSSPLQAIAKGEDKKLITENVLSIYPNPTNASSFIQYNLKGNEKVTIRILSTEGKILQILANGSQMKGMHQVIFNGSKLANGIYYCEAIIGKDRYMRKIVVIK